MILQRGELTRRPPRASALAELLLTWSNENDAFSSERANGVGRHRGSRKWGASGCGTS
ncbi:hypothetical protein XENOCAPTIV_030486, partial [Xenoophorus captivus]